MRQTRSRARRSVRKARRDSKRAPRNRRSRMWAPWIVAALGAALLLSALRIDLIRIRYGLARAVTTEQSLLEKKRELTVAMRQIRNPESLAEKARTLGFVRPEQLIVLPIPESRSVDPPMRTTPAVESPMALIASASKSPQEGGR